MFSLNTLEENLLLHQPVSLEFTSAVYFVIHVNIMCQHIWPSLPTSSSRNGFFCLTWGQLMSQLIFNLQITVSIVGDGQMFLRRCEFAVLWFVWGNSVVAPTCRNRNTSSSFFTETCREQLAILLTADWPHVTHWFHFVLYNSVVVTLRRTVGTYFLVSIWIFKWEMDLQFWLGLVFIISF